jgi:glycosyltransferase involved in cell wall biosynthesis
MHHARSSEGAPLLSIGVPVYNGERYLAEALESALAQDHPNLEVLISDNASTDSTAEICRRFGDDGRVRYSRSPETIEPVANFARVLGMASGRYFGWLAHDDVITSPSYGSTLVERLEANPDAVLCGSALTIFRDDDPQADFVISYEDLAGSRPWERARRALFRWPPDGWETLIYGIFRTDPLRRQVAAHPSLRFPLQRLAFEGRFIVVPDELRAFRLHQGSLARRLGERSQFELLVKGLKNKSRLLGAAMTAPASPRERATVAGVAARNFLGNQMAWAYSTPRQIKALESELAMLRSAAVEREALIRRQGGRLPERTTVPPVPPAARSAGWFRRPGREELDRLADLRARVNDARDVCDGLLAAIE